MSSVSRRIVRNINGRKSSKKLDNEITAAALAVHTGLDLYHARIAMRGTTISKSQLQTALEREQAAELKSLDAEYAA